MLIRSVNVAVSSCGFFLATMLTNVYENGDFRLVLCLLGCSFACLSIFTFAILHTIHSMGQMLADAYR